MCATPYQQSCRSLVAVSVAILVTVGTTLGGTRDNPGDTNCDGGINYSDVDPFVLALSGQAGYEAVYPDCVWLNADCNGDGLVNYADIDPFVELLCGPIGACCMGADADPGYEPYECVGDMHEEDCYALGEGTSWLAGESCDDPLFLCPGTPTYCDGSGGCDEYISRVVCGPIDHETDCAGYGDYTDWTAPAFVGLPLDLAVWNGGLYAGDETIVWVDWNRDKDWDDDGEFVGVVLEQEVSHFVIDVPPTALSGFTRMRIRIAYYPPTPYDPCGTTTWGEVEDYTIIVSDDMPVGACCNPHTGLCTDNVEAIDCLAELEFHIDGLCAELSPACGNPGACCDDGNAICTVEYALNCAGRFVAGATCGPDPFEPPCGDWFPTGVLYCPSNSDNVAFRAAVSALINDDPVDYFDARLDTPTLLQLMQYHSVFTWVNYPYADNVAMGNVLAQYVDQGGRVLLGQWTQPTASNFLAGAIMEVGGSYLPATARTYGPATYSGDGHGAVFVGVETLATSYCDQCCRTAIGTSVGTWTNGYLCAACRPDRHVWVLPGNTGLDFGIGDWAQLTANVHWSSFMGAMGACCNVETGLCEDEVFEEDCLYYPDQFKYDKWCADLDPPCGNPGACCDEETGQCLDAVPKLACAGRHAPGQFCDGEPFAPPCGDWNGCLHAVTLLDDYGDGWNQAHLDIYVGGTLVREDLTLRAGSGPDTVYFYAATGDAIEATFTPGCWPEECSYYISGGEGTVLGCSGMGGATPTGISTTGACPP